MADSPRFGESDEDVAAVAVTLLGQLWIPASTMPENPHEYARVFEWTGPISFHRVVQFIKDFGYWGRYKGHRYKQYDAGDYFHWVLWPPHILINRKHISQKGVDEDAPPRARKPRAQPELEL